MATQEQGKEISQKFKTGFVEFLSDEGFKVIHDEWDGESATWDVYFKQEGKTLMAVFDADDPYFIRLILPNFYSLDDPKEQASALLHTQEANRKCKGAKVYMNSAKNDVVATCEFLATDGTINYDRYLSMLNNVSRAFVSLMRG